MRKKKMNIKAVFLAMGLFVVLACSNGLLKAEEDQTTLSTDTMDSGVDYVLSGESFQNNNITYYGKSTTIAFKLNDISNAAENSPAIYKYTHYLVSANPITDNTDPDKYTEINPNSEVTLSSGMNYICMANLTVTTAGEGANQTTSYIMNTLSNMLVVQVDDMAPQLTIDYQKGYSYLQVSCTEEGSGIKNIYYSTTLISTGKSNWQNSVSKLDLSTMQLPLEQTEKSITYYFIAEDQLGNVNSELEPVRYVFADGIDYTPPAVKEGCEKYEGYVKEEGGIYYYNASAKGKTILTAAFQDNIAFSETNWGSLDVVQGCNEGAVCTASIEKTNNLNLTVTLPDSAQDGSYQFTGDILDKKQNALSYTSKKMIYDTIDPVIENISVLTTAYKEAENGLSIYNNPFKFQVSVTDANPDRLEVYSDSEALAEGTDYTYEVNNEGINYVYKVTLTKNVENARLSLKVIDKADNISASVVIEEKMTLDTLEPKIAEGSVCINGTALTGMEERPVFDQSNNRLTFVIEDEDRFNMDNLEVLLLNDKGATVKQIAVTEQSSHGNTVKLEAGKLSFKDAEYRIKITYTDGAHDECVCITDMFMVDETPPQLTFSTNRSETYTVGENAAKAQVVDIEISDSNIEKNEAEVFTWNLCVTDAKGATINTLHCYVNGKEKRDITPQELQSYLGELSNWEKAKIANTYSVHIEFLTEGNYEITQAFAKDSRFQSEALNNSCNFTIDGTNPYFTADGGGVIFAPKNSKQILKETPYSDFKYITRQDVEVTLVVADEISAIKKVELSYTEAGEKEIKTVEAVADKQKAGKYVFNIPDVGKSFKATVHNISITDGCENTRVHAINQGVIVDKEKQTFELLQVDIQDGNADNKKVIYNKDIELSLSARDTWSGLQAVNYTLNRTEKSKSFTNGNVVYEWNSGEGKIVLKAVSANEGEAIPVILKAIDNAGNEQKVSREYIIDITKPEVSLSFEDGEEGAYFNHDRTAVIMVKDKHVDTKDIVVKVVKDGEEVKVTPAFKTKDNETYTAKISFGKEGRKFEKDGDYQIFVECTDMAGNVADKVKSKKFTIDQTKPVIRISYDNNNAKNGKYYNNQRTATITVEEHNFDASLLNMDIRGSLDGVEINAPSIGEFTSDGDVHTAQVNFRANGDYTISGSITDSAGNTSNSLSQEEFTIDMEAPVVKISGVNRGESYNDVVQPVIEVQDANFNSSDVSIVLQGSKTGTKELKYGKSETAKTGRYRYEDFPHTADNDDYYTLNVQVMDMAGNQYKEELSFKVNRFGSSYSLDEYTRAAVESYYTNVANDFVIVEENVNEIVESELYYSKDGDITYLEKNKDYTVSHEINSENWNVYRYAIKSETITSDGIYSFTIYSKDETGNEMDNKAKELTLDVCIDRTKPICTIIGVEDKGVYEEEEREVSIEVYDNIMLDKVEVYMNGEKNTYLADKIVDDRISIKYSESTKAQTLRVVCYDKAGNVYDTNDNGEISFTLTTNVIATILSKASGSPLPWILLIITGTGVAVFFVIIVVRIKKKGNREKKQ